MDADPQAVVSGRYACKAEYGLIGMIHLHGATRPARGADRAGPMIKEARDEHDRAQAREGPAAPLAGQAPTGASGPRRHPPADRVRVPRRCHG